MSREVYLLGVTETWGFEEQAEAVKNWSEKLGQLGVGALQDIEPVVFRPEQEPYIEIADQIAQQVGDAPVHELDLFKAWRLPFKNAVQTVACLGGSSALALRQNNIERSRYEQRIVLSSDLMSEEFLRHCPSSMYAEVMNSDPREVAYSYIYRDISPRAIKHR